MIYIITLTIAGICFFAILFIIGKHFGDFKMLDLETLREATESKTKKRLVAQRLNRKAVDVKEKFRTITKPASDRISKAFKNFHDKVLELDEQMRQQKIQSGQTTTKDEVKELKSKVTQLIQQKHFDNAEDALIELLKLDSKNLFAYEHLSEIYMERKEYKQARETLQYTIQLLKKNGKDKNRHELAMTYEKLGGVCHLLAKSKDAAQNYKFASELEPKNTKYLDLLLKISIILRDQKLASETLGKLKKVDSDNRKIEGFEKEIKALAEKQGN